jgi:hypothetical protein
MRTLKLPVVPTLLCAALVAGAVIDCGGDDTTDNPTTGAGGSSGTAGTSGTGGASGTATGTGGMSGTSSTGGAGNNGGGGNNGGAGNNGGGGNGGTAGKGGGGSGGVPEAGQDAADACNIHNIIKTAPTVPAGIALPVAGATLVGGYYASGVQIYTCTASVIDGGDGADGGLTGTWVNTASATLYGDNCAVAGQHSFAPGPTWANSDGSTVSASRYAGTAAPVADGGDGGVTAIAWVALQKTGNTGEGAFANVTWVHRVNTSGGVGPSGSCDPALAGADGGVLKVPYTADYFFYTGGTAPVEAGADSSTDASGDASDDGSADSGG